MKGRIFSPDEIDKMEKTGHCPDGFIFPCIFESSVDDVTELEAESPKQNTQPDQMHQTEPEDGAAYCPIYIPVNEEDRQLLRTANQIDQAACKRAEMACPPGMHPAIITYDTPYEQSVMQQKQQLTDSYQRKLNLPIRPILFERPEAICFVPPDDRTAVSVSGSQQPTDMEMAQELLSKVHLKRIGETIYLFTGTYYKKQTSNELQTLIVKALRSKLMISGSARQTRTIEKAIQVEPSIVVDQGQIPKDKRCLLNGVLDLKTMQMEPFNPKYFLTAQMQVSWYGPRSTPVFDQFLYTATGGDLFWENCFIETLAYIVLANSNAGKRFCIMIGEGDTGKSLLARVISAMFSPEDVSAVPLNKMGDNFSLSAMYDAQINVSMDLAQSMLSEASIGVLKNCTGGDKVIINAKYKAPFSATINTRLLFGTNHQLKCGAVDKAFMNRVLCLPFMYPVPRERQNPNLYEEILPELPGILYKFVLAYRTLEKKNFRFLGDSDEIKQMAFNFNTSVNSQTEMLENMILDLCVADPEGFVTTEDLYACYKGYCVKNDVEPNPSVQQFSMKLRPILERNFSVQNKKKRVNKIPMNGYVGIRIKV